jgi:hypothetical protein
MASRMASRIKAKEEARQKKLMDGDLFSSTASKARVIDVLRNSTHLPKGQVVRDILGFGCDPKRIDASIALPQRTLESYY